ncbi:MAG: efflux transporter outer membrane subunit [Burkholderiales bacterium]|nr:efflux transporter outer membrane subunit [Burkholderiales bacterium]
MQQHLRSALGPLTAALALVGCASAPPYEAPPPPAVAGYTASALAAPTASAPGLHGQAQQWVDGAVEGAWWRALQSSALNALVDEALHASPTLAAAQAVLTQARELHAAQAGATQLPQVDLGLGAQRQQTSPSAQGLPGNPREFSLYSASVGVRYRFDAGGGIDSSLRAAAARADVRQHELAAARHALAANLAMAAITRARLAAQIESLSAILRTQQSLADLAQVRTRLGQAAPDEVSALTAQAEQTRAALPALRKQLQQTEHLLAVLAGRPPAQGAPAFTLEDFTLPGQLSVAVPSEWARRRPDIQAAEAALRAAHGDLGVAIARQYPQFTLSANLGSQALTTSALFGGSAAVWSVLGQISQPLFNASLPAERRAAQAALEAATANYQRVVLEALRNVADALSAAEHDAQTLAALARSAQAAEEQHRVAVSQHRAGAASPVQLLVADQVLLQARSNLAAAQAQRLVDTVALGAALAGDPAPRQDPQASLRNPRE